MIKELSQILVRFLVLATFTSATPTPLELTIRDHMPTPSKLQKDLAHKLSKGSSVYFHISADYKAYVGRWSKKSEGDILLVVVPVTATDVATTVSPNPPPTACSP